jgi:hypothetical protein
VTFVQHLLTSPTVASSRSPLFTLHQLTLTLTWRELFVSHQLVHDPPSETQLIQIIDKCQATRNSSMEHSAGHSVAMKMHSDNRACDSNDPRAKGVENTVYYPTRPLPKPAPVEYFSFGSDRARFMMVLRWMVFYKYIPGNTAELESPRADLRKHLEFSSPEYGAKLGWFLNRQFKTFKEQGLVTQKMDRQPAI